LAGVVKGASRHLGVYLGLVAVPAAAAVLAIVQLADGRGVGTGPAVDGSGLVVYRLLVATGVVVGLATLGGLLARKLRQPEVIGQMAAGILLGPSVFGALLPGAQRWLFAPIVLPYLDALAQFGVVFFMFLVGTELAPGSLRRSGPRALTIGHASIAVPFLAGIAVAWLVRDRYQPEGQGSLPFLLFVGLSFAITAFPVLAGILADRGLLRTPLGATAMTAAGIGDVTAWCLLAVVVALVRGTAVTRALLAVVLTAGFVLVMLGLVRPLLERAVPRAGQGASRAAAMAGLICLVLAAAVATDWIGVHAIFGAFLAGVAMPRGSELVAELIVKIEGITLWLMLPLFFASVGMRTELGTLSGATQWLLCLVIVLVAVVGKMVGAGVAARATGGSTRESLALGTMMSCRGLTELIVLNLGLQLGVLRPELFVMFVVMALLTTAMTGPLLRLVLGPGDRVAAAEAELAVLKGR
jgi:Kef-type K+ transport system membrane component KefB